MRAARHDAHQANPESRGPFRIENFPKFLSLTRTPPDDRSLWLLGTDLACPCPQGCNPVTFSVSLYLPTRVFMTVDFEAIARRTGSEISSLKLALPLVEQGFSPPFLARYRRDELGGIGEPALWMLQRQIRSDRALSERRRELKEFWQQTVLADPSIGRAIDEAKSKSAIGRVSRRLKGEASDPQAALPPALWVACRILNPQPNDPVEIPELAAAVNQGDHVAEIVDTLDAVLTKRLAEHPQVLGTAVRWLNANASIRFLEVGDPNIEVGGHAETAAAHVDAAHSDRPQTEPGAHWPSPEQLTAEPVPPTAPTPTASPSEAATSEAATSEAVSETPIGEVTAGEGLAEASMPPTGGAASGEAIPVEPTVVADPAAGGETSVNAELPAATDAAEVGETPTADPPVGQATKPEGSGDGSSEPASEGSAVAAEDAPAAAVTTSPIRPKSGADAGAGKKHPKAAAPKPAKKTKVLKKLSPRQRRRRWLISILQPLVGKEIPIRKLTPFQTIVLSRALRGNLVKCQFVYDANQLIGQLQKTAANLNPAMADRLSDTVARHEATVRDATESIWWDELQEGATAELVDLTARHLNAHLHRGPVEAKVVLAIDAVGPRTSPLAIVSGDGSLLHTEDIPSQLENESRSMAVTRLGELIHRHGVDLIVVSNGPARRSAMIVLGELINQSPEGSIRWTLAERSGADAYSGSEIADREMRTTPRRFRAATWLAFSLLKPAWALAKVNPVRLRLSSAQRELPDDLLAPALRDVMASAISRGGLDVNSAPVDALTQLPGMTRRVAEAIDRQRRKALFTSRDEVLELDAWEDDMCRRQAIGFLRVFGGTEPLDATGIHPEDYSLARKLGKALSLELPPSAPPGYQPPSFDETGRGDSAAPKAEATPPVEAVVATADSGETESPKAFAAELQAADAAAAGEASQAGEAGVSPEPESAEPTAASAVANESESAAIDEATPTEAVTKPGEAAAVADEPNADAGAESATQTSPAVEPTPPADTASAYRLPLPEPAAINKCIREWQVGSNRTHRIVQSLCDPFGEESVANPGEPPAVMTRVPKNSQLRPGDSVVGVVASVAPFGAFVEISPEATGLVRVSRLAEEFVEEIHDYIQVGDVVSAWVTEVDSKRKLQLSAMSPAREEELRRIREEQRDRRPFRGNGPRRGGQGSGHAGGQGGGQAAAQGSGGGQRAGVATGGGGRDQGRGGPRHGQGGGQPAGGRGGRDDSRRTGGRDQRGQGGGRGRDSRSRRDEPISYTTRVPKNQPPAEPITEAMAEGREPLRSFGDLLQFYKKDQPEPPTKKSVKPTDSNRPERKPSANEAGDDSAKGDSAVMPPPTQAQTVQPTGAEAAGQAETPRAAEPRPEAAQGDAGRPSDSPAPDTGSSA